MPARPPSREDAKPQHGVFSLNAEQPEASHDQHWHRASQIALIGLLVIALLWCAYVAQHVIVPVLLAWTIATIVLPIVEGQFITPTLMGKRLEINPFAVFLAIAFCTWFWGPVGAFLAVPLLMALTVALEHSFEEEKPDLPH